MYVAVKGGERAIENAHGLLAEDRRGDTEVPELTPDQIREQMKLAVDRVMTEGSLYDRELAALALKQARGDQIEAIFLLRAYRTTLPRFAASRPVDTGAMVVERRVSATFKDLPGGQILGPTFDYTHRLIDHDLAAPHRPRPCAEAAPVDEAMPRVLDLLACEGLIEPADPADPAAPDPPDASGAADREDGQPADITREPPRFPAGRDARLQTLARGDEGFLLALAYSSQRGYGRTHPFAGEIRLGTVPVCIAPEELGFEIEIGEIELTECQMVNQFTGGADRAPCFTRGYGLAFGHGERKAMSMALVDRSLRADAFEETRDAPVQDEEFVLSHCDNVQATGFVEHLKLPHYVDFQSELELLRRLRREHDARNGPDDKAEAAE
ncbi:carbon-phosphorus lyase complex subunit PhnI [Marivibrio halodurans]|uniref:Carbon-phosphorus lyase complex subunit PhnI n=1 Tax=Marivibrio halodurans TaxID=2039722 RepID=A0A8J7RXZ8_9PROT|nr:carbon-phosphorus lyase complex subunit PhnI [Marivibrio halodurans]MBP5856465.1 carbon-phosphorus lyase complex subunit PhnI [Marivibrio halodurans]